MANIEKNCCAIVDDVVLQNGVSAGYTDVDADTKRFNMFCDKGYISQPKRFVGALDRNGNFYRFTKRGEK